MFRTRPLASKPKANIRRSTPNPSAAPMKRAYILMICRIITASAVALTFVLPARGFPQTDGQRPIRVEKNLILIQAGVVDAKLKDQKLTEAQNRCDQADQDTVATVPASEPYLPKPCEAVTVSGLGPKNFLVFFDGKKQKVEGVTTESEWVIVRDNRGMHNEMSDVPSGKWSTRDGALPRVGERAVGEGNALVYNIALAQDSSLPRGCHNVRIRVDRPHSRVYTRDEYCDAQQEGDTLRGSKLGSWMEKKLTSTDAGKFPVSLQVGYVYRGANSARVLIAVRFPPDSLHSWWGSDEHFHATIGTLEMVYGKNGGIESRFSSFGCCTGYLGASFVGTGHLFQTFYHDPTDPEMWTFFKAIVELMARQRLPARYETQLELAPGQYEARVVVGDGEKFGRAATHLSIDKYDEKELALSSVVLCNRFRDARVAAIESAAANLAPEYVPLVSKNIQFTPAADTRFKTGEPLIAYFEVYEPSASQLPDAIEAHLRVADAATGAIVKDYPPVDIKSYRRSGTTIFAVARAVPKEKLPKGSYRLEVQASDSAGRTTAWRATNFAVE